MDLLLDLLQCLCRLHRRHGTPDDIAAQILQFMNLGYGCCNILCLCICHRLDCHRISSADGNVSDMNYFCMISVHFHHTFPY